MLTIEMLDLLNCPSCRGRGLIAEIRLQEADRIEEGSLKCEACGAEYAVVGGVANLAPASLLESSDWQRWSDHLEGLQARRQVRPGSSKNGRAKTATVKQAFAQFVGRVDGRLLDVGCGAGKLRHRFPDVDYYGLDPIPLPESRDFRFVRAVAESIPYQDAVFSHLVVVSSLDHFVDLDAFFGEVVRVLEPDGRFHLIQSLHEASGVMGAVKMLTHHIKDALDSRATKVKNPDAPKHMHEFSEVSLQKALGKRFEILDMQEFSPHWYSLRKEFLSLRPLGHST